MRTCNRCNTPKPLDQYAKSQTGKGGRRNTCKQCINVRQWPRGWRGPTARLPGYVTREIGL